MRPRCTRPMRRLIHAALLAAALAGGAAADDDAARERTQIRAALRTAAAGDLDGALRQARGLEAHPLHPYLRYEHLSRRMHKVPREEVRTFLAANEDSFIGDRLRTEWLKHLARNQLWREFLADYRPQTETKLRCWQLVARVRTGASEGVARDALPLWMVGDSQVPECDPAFAVLYASPLMTDDTVWQRMRLALANGRPQLAGVLGRRLSAPLRRWVEPWLLAHGEPLKALRDPRLRSDAPQAREILVHAFVRLARTDLKRALAAWDERRDAPVWSRWDRAAIVRALALAAESAGHPRTRELLDDVPAIGVEARVQEARLREALRREDWQALARWTEQPAAPGMEDLRWRYWRARALEGAGRAEEARPMFEDLAGERDYYGFRAADRLGTEYRMHNRRVRLGPDELRRLLRRPGIARAREFHALGMVFEARREWWYETSRMGVDDLLLAAAFAHRLGWHDRAVLTLARAGVVDDLVLRFPTPFESIVVRQAQRTDLPPELVYSIIKSESAFMADARSPVGAMGLMQLMPATARETAKRTGRKLGRPEDLYTPEVNVALGTAYLKHMLDHYEGNLAMAAAAYNAGPGRVRAWRPVSGCMDAERWMELVPFRETRRYVRQAFFNATVYEWRLADRTRRIGDRLAPVPPRHARVATC